MTTLMRTAKPRGNLTPDTEQGQPITIADGWIVEGFPRQAGQILRTHEQDGKPKHDRTMVRTDLTHTQPRNHAGAFTQPGERRMATTNRASGP